MQIDDSKLFEALFAFLIFEIMQFLSVDIVTSEAFDEGFEFGYMGSAGEVADHLSAQMLPITLDIMVDWSFALARHADRHQFAQNIFER